MNSNFSKILDSQHVQGRKSISKLTVAGLPRLHPALVHMIPIIGGICDVGIIQSSQGVLRAAHRQCGVDGYWVEFLSGTKCDRMIQDDSVIGNVDYDVGRQHWRCACAWINVEARSGDGKALCQ